MTAAAVSCPRGRAAEGLWLLLSCPSSNAAPIDVLLLAAWSEVVFVGADRGGIRLRRLLGRRRCGGLFRWLSVKPFRPVDPPHDFEVWAVVGGRLALPGRLDRSGPGHSRQRQLAGVGR